MQVYYGLDPVMLGRRDEEFPVTRCCEADRCLVQDRQPRYAVLTYIRTDAYFPLLQVTNWQPRRLVRLQEGSALLPIFLSCQLGS